MLADPASQQNMGTSYPVPTDPNYYLQQMGLNQLIPQAMTSNSMAAMFAPQGLQYTPANALASNPFLQLYMNSSAQGTRLARPQVGQPSPPPEG